MKISELKAGATNVDVEGKVVEKAEPREVVTKYGKRVNVANISIKDDSGSITMSLWGDDINSVNVGDKVHITGGYVGEFRGSPQLSTGKFGKLEVVEQGSGSPSAETNADEYKDELGDEES
jgi:ssDNA-binding replication factor A large subunit